VIVVGNSLSVPGNILGAFAEKVVLASCGPKPFEFILEEAAIFQRIGGTAFCLPDDLLPVKWIV
jgi:hypothetical protein